MHRHTDAERDRGQKLLAEVSDVFLRRGHNLCDLPMSMSTRRVRGLGVEIAMTPYRSCAPPSTICSARDGCWGAALLRRVFWWRHCWIAGPTVTWPKPRPRSTGWRPRQPTTGLVIREIWLLRMRALLARAHGDDAAYRDYRDRYRAMATSLGFEGHMKWAEAMP